MSILLCASEYAFVYCTIITFPYLKSMVPRVHNCSFTLALFSMYFYCFFPYLSFECIFSLKIFQFLRYSVNDIYFQELLQPEFPLNHLDWFIYRLLPWDFFPFSTFLHESPFIRSSILFFLSLLSYSAGTHFSRPSYKWMQKRFFKIVSLYCEDIFFVCFHLLDSLTGYKILVWK